MGKCGLGKMPMEKRREISAKGGRAAHAKGVAHRWTEDEALKAGQKGARKSALSKARSRLDAQALKVRRELLIKSVFGK